MVGIQPLQATQIERSDKAPPLWGECPVTERRAVQTHSVSVDDLSDRDVDDGLGDGDQVWVLIHVKLLLQRWNVTRRQEETPAGDGKGKENNDSNYTDVMIWTSAVRPSENWI